MALEKKYSVLRLQKRVSAFLSTHGISDSVSDTYAIISVQAAN
jgi:hypothetical protein